MTHPTSSRTFILPFGVRITVDHSGNGELESNLFHEFMDYDGPTGDAVARAAADAMESLLLAMACAGIELEMAAFKEEIQSAVESMASQL